MKARLKKKTDKKKTGYNANEKKMYNLMDHIFYIKKIGILVGQPKVRNETDQYNAVIHATPDTAATSPEITSGQGENALLKIKKLKTKNMKLRNLQHYAQRLVFTEQLKTTRIQRRYYLDKLKRSGTVIEEETLKI
jgi:hypothetical protein